MSPCRSLTALLAFLIGGLVVLATGHNPLVAYRDIFNGAGLNWFFHPSTDTARNDAYNLTQTLLQTTSLILTGLAVAFAFRCGMFNIGGQGQYFVGLFVAALDRPRIRRHGDRRLTSCSGSSRRPSAGAVWAGIAGVLKATVGAHEVITTIMLNWIAIWVGTYLFGDGGPLQGADNKAAHVPISADVANSAKLPVFWGDKDLQGLHVGFFVAIGALVVFSLLLNRTTLGYEVRAVGYNPESAAYGGINVKKNLVRALAISGAFAGLAGGLDMLGYLYRYGVSDIPTSRDRLPRHRRRTARPQHRRRRRARRVAVRRAAVRDDARTPIEHDRPAGRRQPHVHDPGADRALRRRRRAHPRGLEQSPAPPPQGRLGHGSFRRMSITAERQSREALLRLASPRAVGILALLLGVFAAFLSLPPIEARTILWPILVGLVGAVLGVWTAMRGLRRLGWGAVVLSAIGIGLGILATRSGTENLNSVFTASLIASMLVFSTPLVFAGIGGMYSERSGVVNIGLEGMMLMGAFFGVYGADKGGSWVVGVVVGDGRRRRARARARHLRDPPSRGSDRGRNRGQLPRARNHRLLLLPAVPRRGRAGGHLDDPARRSSVDRGRCISSALRSGT